MCKNGYVDIVEFLFVYGVEVNCYDSSGLSFLIIVCKYVKNLVVECLLNNGVDIN